MKKALIVYFSHKKENYVDGSVVYLTQGNTEVVAQKIHQKLESDIFEIRPIQEYPSDYYDCIEAAKKELAQQIRPSIQKMELDMDKYTDVYLGFPNWWGTIPMCVCTFLESNNFTDKILHPFITHEGSGFSKSIEDIKKLCPDAIVEKGLSIKGSMVHKSDDSIDAWLSNKS